MNSLGRRVVDHLAPRIGKVTATNAVVLAAGKIGVDPDRLTREDLPEIARNTVTILRVFLGPEAASQLEGEIAALEVDE